jgi:hypothetical protein
MTRCPSWLHHLTSANGQSAVAFDLGADATVWRWRVLSSGFPKVLGRCSAARGRS